MVKITPHEPEEASNIFTYSNLVQRGTPGIVVVIFWLGIILTSPERPIDCSYDCCLTTEFSRAARKASSAGAIG